MSVSVESQSYSDENLVIEERIVEIEGDETVLWFESRLPDNNALILIQFLSGEPEVLPDIPIPEIDAGDRRRLGRMFAGAIDQGARAFIRLAAGGLVKVRVIFAQLRKQIVAAKNAFPCKFCKLAVKTVLSAVVWHLGVPALPSGDFDLSGVGSAIQSAGADIMAGNFGDLVKQLASLLPTDFWDAVLQGLAALNWLFDLSDKLNTWVCTQIKMCP